MGKRFRGFLFVCLVLVTFWANLNSQENPDQSLLTLERIFDSREFAPARFGPARWMKDGKSYTTVEDSAAVKGGEGMVLLSGESRGRGGGRSTSRRTGTRASADQAAAVKALLQEWPYVDPGRVGVWGWSGGGSLTLNAMFRYPALYNAGTA